MFIETLKKDNWSKFMDGRVEALLEMVRTVLPPPTS
jgi:NADP-dependent 3-hydroxy acid dehydrogenase YdfG